MSETQFKVTWLPLRIKVYEEYKETWISSKQKKILRKMESKVKAKTWKFLSVQQKEFVNKNRITWKVKYYELVLEEYSYLTLRVSTDIEGKRVVEDKDVYISTDGLGLDWILDTKFYRNKTIEATSEIIVKLLKSI